MERFTEEYLKDLPVKDLGEIFLRPVKLEDYLDMYEYGKDDEVTKTVIWNSYRSVEDAIDSIKKVFLPRPEKGVPSAYAIVHKETNKMIGTCDIFRINYETMEGEIGYVLNRQYWGRGYMTLACEAVLDLGFNYLYLNKVHIGHMKENIGSRRVIEKCGFRLTKEGKHSRLNIEGREYEMTKEEYLNRK